MSLQEYCQRKSGFLHLSEQRLGKNFIVKSILGKWLKSHKMELCEAEASNLVSERK